MATQRDLACYKCVCCNGPRLELEKRDARCASCGVVFPIEQNIIDFLTDPSAEVVKEMKGMAREMGFELDEWEKIKIRKVDKHTTYDELLELTSKDQTNYYRQTLKCFQQALRELGDFKPKRVLEVGAHPDYYFLQHFRDLGAECHVLNLHLEYTDNDPFEHWPLKCLGDMNQLPFKEDTFDLVLLSATSHHSPCLEQTIREINRVLQPGGVALVINDQIDGFFKVIKADHMHGRDQLIHENFYSIWRYHLAFARNKLRPQYLFSDFYDEKLRSGQIKKGLRFAAVGQLLKYPWQFEAFRSFAKKKLIWPAHALFGFPLNVILRKDAPS